MGAPPGRLLRILLPALGLVVVVAAAGLAWWHLGHGEAWLERKVRERIAEVIEEASVQGYHFTMEDLHADARTGRLMVLGAELEFAPELVDSLRLGTFHYLFAAKAQRIELRGLSFWRLLWRREFRVEAFELMGPELKYLVGGDRVRLDDPFTRLEQAGGGGVSLLSADTLVVHRAAAVVNDLGERLPVMYVNGLDVQGRGVRITRRERQGGVRLVVSGAELQLDSLQTQLPDGDLLGIGAVRLSRSSRSGSIGTVRWRGERPDTTRMDRVRTHVMDASVDSILLTGLDVDRLISDQALRIGHMALYSMSVEVELDKTLPSGEPVVKQLPPAALLDLPFPVRIDTLSFQDAAAAYRERDDDTRRWGRIGFPKLNARFLHVSNEARAIAAHPFIQGEFSGLFNDSAHFEGTCRAELDGSERFTFNASVIGLDLVDINSATRTLLRVKVDGGRLHRMDMSMWGDERRAKGRVALNYSDLLVRVEPGTPHALRSSMFGNVIETMLTEAYGGGLSAERERNYAIERDPHRSMITYIWHALREGLARNLAPEAWGRMRQMLRTDAGQRREQRDQRRQRKQQRQKRR